VEFEINDRTWNELNSLLDEFLDLPEPERQAWLERMEPRYRVQQPRLWSFLTKAAQVETQDFLEAPPRIGVPLSAEEVSRESVAGAAVGPYRLLHELGSGGMGTVWLAERADGMMKRPVALKLPHVSFMARRAGLVERLAREREILATLSHPNIATLYDAGVAADGQLYLALEYVAGEPIDRYCESRHLQTRARVELFLQVAKAVAHAHAKLVVHRDLKPSNILVTQEGQVRLLDFGIAKLLDDGVAKQTALTELSGRALTPDYASPEQILGLPITIASDVYSLGVILYELLAGKRPYQLRRESRGALEDAIVQADVVAPGNLAEPVARKALRGDLDTIVLKALKKKAEDRYPTVNALADDLQRFLDSRPVLARPDGAWYRFTRFAARHRVPLAASIILLVAIVAAAGFSVWQARVAVAERDRAQEVRAFIESIFRNADPWADSGQLMTAAQLLHNAERSIDERFANREDLKLDLLGLVGSSLTNLNDLEGARHTLQRAVDAATKSYGVEHARTVKLRFLLADVHNNLRDLDTVRRELADLEPAALRLRSTDPTILIGVRMLQAELAIEEGRYDDATGPARAGFELARSSLGDKHPTTIGLSALLAESFLHTDGSIEETLQETERGLRFVLDAYGDNSQHPLVMRVRGIRARALSVAGRFREAINEMRPVIAAADQALGSSNTLSATARGDIAAWERRTGALQESLANSDASLRFAEARGGRSSADFLAAQVTRGTTLIAARRPAQAVADLSEAESAYLQLFGRDHWDTVTARLNKAMALAYLGRFPEARASLAIVDEPAFENKFPNWVAYVRGVVERLSGEYDRAVRSQLLAESQVLPGPRADWDRVRAVAELGLAELARGHGADAEQALSRARDIFVGLATEMHPAYAEVLTGLSQIQIQSGDAADALADLEKVAAYWRDFDPESRSAGVATLWLGRCYAALGRRGEADLALSQAKRLLQHSPLPQDRKLLVPARQRGQ